MYLLGYPLLRKNFLKKIKIPSKNFPNNKICIYTLYGTTLGPKYPCFVAVQYSHYIKILKCYRLGLMEECTVLFILRAQKKGFFLFTNATVKFRIFNF